MNKLITIFITLSLLTTSGCSWFGGEDEEKAFQPVPLPEITKVFSVSPKWRVQVGEGVGEFYNKLGPVVYNNTVYVADSKGLVKALNPEDGKEIWKTEVAAELFGGVAAGGGLVVVGSTEAEIIALDAKTGVEKWRNLVSSEVVSSPAISEGKVLSRTIDGKLFAMDAATGERAWLYDRSVPPLTLTGLSSISVGRGAAVTGFSNGKVALFIIENGQAVWEKRVATSAGSSELDRVVDADATPLIAGEVVYAVTFKGNIAAYNMRDGEVLWQRELSSYQNMSVSGQLLSVTDARSNIKVLDRRTGGTLWTQSALTYRRLTATAAIGDYLVAGDYEGYLHWFNKNEGFMVSRNDLGGDGIVADPVVAGDSLYVYTRDGSLYCFDKP